MPSAARSTAQPGAILSVMDSNAPAPRHPPAPRISRIGTAAVEHREDIFFAAVETTRMPMVVTDPNAPDNPIIFANQAFLLMTGYPSAEILGRNCRFLQGPETDRAAIDAVRDAVAAREEVSTEILNYKKDGTTFWNALFIAPVFDKQGKLIYFFASQLDVSRRRDAEDALGQAQKMEALGQLTGGISHDFNNLLQVMLGHIDILDRRLRADPVDPRVIATASRSIRSAVEKAATLTQQLLAFARKQRLEGRLTNLNRLSDNLADLAARTLGGDIRMEMDLAPDLHNCRIDPTQFEVALLNILINARDAMEGGGTVRIRTANMAVQAGDVRAYAGVELGEYATIEVMDTGPGIPPEIVHRVVEPFFTTKDEGKGTGLGLSMVHGFAKQSGGGMQIDSRPGEGTTIRLYFPIAFDGEAPAVSQARRSRERGGNECILVVDDRAEVLDVACALLEELGYRVVAAGSGSEALQRFEALDVAARPALLFSDVIMPGGINGFMLARKLRAQMPKLKVLLTTGFAGEAQGGEATSGEFEVLRKPYKLDELARRVRMVLDGPTGVG